MTLRNIDLDNWAKRIVDTGWRNPLSLQNHDQCIHCKKNILIYYFTHEGLKMNHYPHADDCLYQEALDYVGDNECH